MVKCLDEKSCLRVLVVLFLCFTIVREAFFAREMDNDDSLPTIEEGVARAATQRSAEEVVRDKILTEIHRRGEEGEMNTLERFFKLNSDGFSSLPYQGSGTHGATSSRKRNSTTEDEPVVHVFVINLNSNVDRHFVAQHRIDDEPGFQFHHVPAVNARALKEGCGGPMEEPKFVSDAKKDDDIPFMDLECIAQSHMKALVMGAEYLIDDNDFIVIMEDDVSFGLRPFWRHNSLRQVAAGWTETHCDWSLVLLAPWLKDEHWAGMYYHYLTESTNWQLLRKHRGDLFWGAAAFVSMH